MSDGITCVECLNKASFVDEDGVCIDCSSGADDEAIARIDQKEHIAAIIFDHEYSEDDSRPSEEACHKIAETILDYFDILKDQEGE